ncbi:hypothetical protein HPP92_027360, partial [Vanilla planifolia]
FLLCSVSKLKNSGQANVLVHRHEIFGLHRLDEFVSSPVDGKIVENVQNMMNEHVKLVCHEKKVGNDSTGGFSRRVWNAGISFASSCGT